jgi:putative component of toxin-antitoxin plasmid stabilization module
LLRDGVYELRTEVGKVNYRILYGFVGKNVAVLACGLTKENTVPSGEIDTAVTRIGKYKKNPTQHRFVYEEESPDG